MSRIKLLQSAEIRSFDQPPVFNSEQQDLFFTLTSELIPWYESLRQPHTRLGFLLQLGYFRSQGRFYGVADFRKDDIAYLQKRYGLTIPEEEPLREYRLQSVEQHRKKILHLLGWLAFDDAKGEFDQQITALTNLHLMPRKVLWETRSYLFRKRIEAPGYDTYLRAITQALLTLSRQTNLLLETQLTDAYRQLLDDLLQKNRSTHRADLVSYKTINQSLQPRAIKTSLEIFKLLKAKLTQLEPLVNALRLSDATIEYHAYWAGVAEIDKIQAHSEKYMFLLCFLIRQVRLRQDFFIDIILQSVKAAENQVKRLQKDSYFQDGRGRQKATELLIQSRMSYREQMLAIKAVMRSALSDREKLVTIEFLLEVDLDLPPHQEQQVQTLASELVKDDQKAYYHLLEKRSRWLHNRLSAIIRHLSFNEENTNPLLLEALKHYAGKKGKVTTPPNNLSWLSDTQQDLLYVVDSQTGKQTFNGRLYRVLLYGALNEGIKSGTINFHHSYRYRFLEEYLLDKKEWDQNRQRLLQEAEIAHLSDYYAVMQGLRQHLDTLYHQTNFRYLQGKNPHLKFGKEGIALIDTPAVEKPDLLRVAHYFRPAHYVSILTVLADVEKAAPFLHHFGHGSKTEEKKRPDAQTFFGAILALGCNIGMDRMGTISKGLHSHTLKHTANWYLSSQSLQDANDAIIRMKNELALPELHRKDAKETHTASDGQKILLTQESLNATYSAKYPGFNKAASINTAVDERFALFYSAVITAADREAVSMVDMHLGNPVVKSTIHSTDTHGTSEVVFGLMHLLDIFFAPRIKNLGSQELYSFVSRKEYAQLGYPLLPDHYINTLLIETHWQEILRLLASLKLGKTSAFQILKRLNSYSKQNPLYKALKEFGKIIRSCFILKYLDDLPLRQSVEKQLSHIEMMNRFSKAIFFGNNQEFTVATKDEQERIILCRRLIQNAIVLWNYLYLSDLLAKTKTQKELNEMLQVIRNGTAVVWQHINLLGEYDFNQLSEDQVSRFDMQQLLAWRYLSAA